MFRNTLLAAIGLIAVSGSLHAAPSNLQKAKPIIKAAAAQYGVTAIGKIKLLGPVSGMPGVFTYSAVKKIHATSRLGGGSATGQVNLTAGTATFETIFPFEK